MEGLDLDLKVTAYGQSTTHWWALSVPTHPVEAISSAPTTSLSDTIHRDDIAAQSVSTYPVFDDGKRRDGDPIADVYAVRLYENGACFGLADGCGWGPRSCKAANDAIAGFSEYVERKISSVTNVSAAARFLLRAVCSAHDRIWTKNQQTWEVGTTTILGALLVKVDEEAEAPEDSPFKGAPYVLVCANIGDCKAFVISGGKQHDVIDITVESKRTSKDKCDPGGRIGPYINGNPDTRNLLVSTIPVYPGDTICLVSDGVHDNLDPETLGLTLQQSMDRNPAISKRMLEENASGDKKEGALPENLNTNKAWEALGAEWSELLKAEYREHVIGQLIEKGADTPSKLLESLFDHCMVTTKASRDFMETNPANVHPPDYTTFPGKMDHTTGIIYLVPGTPPENRPFRPHNFTSTEEHDAPANDKRGKKQKKHKESSSVPAASGPIVEMPPRKSKSSKKAEQDSTPTSSSTKETEVEEDATEEPTIEESSTTKAHKKKSKYASADMDSAPHSDETKEEEDRHDARHKRRRKKSRELSASQQL